MRKREPFKRGSKGLLYINQGVSDDLIEFINNQTELNGVLLLGLKRLADEYGLVDLIRVLPRTFELEKEIQGSHTNIQQKAPVPVKNKTVENPTVTNSTTHSSLDNIEIKKDTLLSGISLEDLANELSKRQDLDIKGQKIQVIQEVVEPVTIDIHATPSTTNESSVPQNTAESSTETSHEESETKNNSENNFSNLKGDPWLNQFK